jgi:hypothetical protein
MINLTQAIWLAGVIQLLIAGANIFIPQKLGYGENLRKVTPIFRQIFIVHAVYIVWVLLAFSAICLFFAGDLARGTGLSRFLSGWMALFWGVRIFIQRFYYTDDAKKLNRFADVGFTLAFVYLAAVLAFAALRPFL